MNIFASVLPLLKKYVMFFERKEPSIHKLYDELFALLREILSWFIKPEVISANASPKKLSVLGVAKPENCLHGKQIFLGVKAKRKVEKSVFNCPCR